MLEENIEVCKPGNDTYIFVREDSKIIIQGYPTSENNFHDSLEIDTLDIYQYAHQFDEQLKCDGIDICSESASYPAGVFGDETQELIVQKYSRISWDCWMVIRILSVLGHSTISRY